MKKLMLIDGHSIINRAFYAMPLLSNKDGLFTNAILGFMNMFYKFADEEAPDFVAVAFDVNAPTKRHSFFSEYKGNRKPMPMELRPQIPVLKELLLALNIKIYELEGFEADDILGTLAKQAEKQNLEVVIVSGDRDLLQIASDNIKIKIPKTKAGKTVEENYYAKDVEEIYGVTPIQIIDIKALMGDASDNIPGIAGIGEKTAIKIIKEFKSLENSIEHAGDIKPKKASENLAKGKEIAVLSKLLATIDTDAPIEIDLKAFDPGLTGEGAAMLKELGFKNLLKRALSLEPNKEIKPVSKKEFILVKDIDEFIETLLKQELVSFCIFEHMNEINGISFSFNPQSAYLIEIDTALTKMYVLEKLRPFFENTKKLTFDLKHTYHLLDPLSVKHVTFDMLLAGYVLEPTKNNYSLNLMIYEYLDETIEEEDYLLGKGKSKISILDLPAYERLNYCCSLANGAFRLYDVLENKIRAKGLSMLYYEIEMPLTDILFNMEKTGILIDRAALTAFNDRLSYRIDELTQEIYSDAGTEFNINSTKQLANILFDVLYLTPVKKNKTGYSTDIEALEPIKHEHPIVNKIIEYRQYTKLKSTYGDGLLSALDPQTNKLHTTFNQAVTATGRLSSSEPNLQNIPIRLELGRELRRVFIPENEYVFADADYSQIELRILAHLSGDEKLIEAFNSGQDIHRLTASQVNNMPYELITPGLRNAAKAVNFGIIYGISAYSLSVDLGITKKEADSYINAYFKAYPRIKAYLDDSIMTAKETGFSKTITGRLRAMPELKSMNYNIRSFGERVAMNMPIQGSAADIIKIAMIKVYNRLKDRGLKSKLLLQVHDELLVMAHKSEINEVKEIMIKEMESAYEMAVPLTVDIHTGETWFDAK